MSTDEIMSLAEAFAQEVKDFGYIDESPCRAALLDALQEIIAHQDQSRPH